MFGPGALCDIGSFGAGVFSDIGLHESFGTGVFWLGRGPLRLVVFLWTRDLLGHWVFVRLGVVWDRTLLRQAFFWDMGSPWYMWSFETRVLWDSGLLGHGAFFGIGSL